MLAQIIEDLLPATGPTPPEAYELVREVLRYANLTAALKSNPELLERSPS